MIDPYTDTTQRQRMPRAEIPGCALVQDLIPLYLDGEVTPESHVLIADHLQDCERCSGYLAGARSVRSQMLRDQQAIKAATAAEPTVAQVQQPVSNGLGIMLWQTLMTLTWLAGLFLGLVGTAEETPEAVLISVMLVFIAVTGFAAVGRAHRLAWRLLMVPTWPVGLFMMAYPVFTEYGGGPESVFGGLALLGLAVWGMRSRREPAQPVTTQLRQRGASAAFFKGAMSVLGVLGCGLLALGGIFMLLIPDTAPHFFGVGMAMIGAAGLVLINQRRAWLSQWATPQATRQLLGLTLLGGGLLLSIMVIQLWISGLMPFVFALGIGAALTVVGYRMAQRHSRDAVDRQR